MSEAVGQQPVYVVDERGLPIALNSLLESILRELQAINGTLLSLSQEEKL